MSTRAVEPQISTDRILIATHVFKQNSDFVITLRDCTVVVDDLISYVNSGDNDDNISDDSLTMLPTHNNDNDTDLMKYTCDGLLHTMFMCETGNYINPTIFTGSISGVHYASNLCTECDIIALSLMYYEYNHY